MTKNKMEPLVTIITINFNHLEYTLQLLDSLKKSTYQNLEVIVVDNGSDVNPGSAVTDRYPGARVIRSEKNLGFAGGNNLALDMARGKYLFFLNNDTEIHPDAIRPLVNLFETTPDAGMASPKILYHDSGNVIQYVGCSRMDPYTGRNRREGFKEKDTGAYDTLRKTDLAHGAAMMVPRKVVEEVGPMAEVFFLYYEELDWCENIKKAGYHVYVVPQSTVYHKESISIGKNSTLKTYYMTRNRLLFMRRHTSGWLKLSWILFFLFFSIPKNSLAFILRNEMPHLKAFWKGFIWNLKHGTDGKKTHLQQQCV